jgi:dethiobiotin synthetase
MYQSIFISGIGTDIGKTFVSAILCHALGWAYWKPVQCGNLDDSDSNYIKKVCPESIVFPETYRLKAPMSPHAAAALEHVQISLTGFSLPQSNGLIIEGAGGLMVPLNERDTILDLMLHLKTPCILVSKNYLGSINHTLLSIEVLRYREIPILGIIFNGDENHATQDIILEKTQIPSLGRIPLIKEPNFKNIKNESEKLKERLHANGIHSK